MQADKSKLVRRGVKGFPLTHAELDGNFTELSKLIDDVSSYESTNNTAVTALSQLNAEQNVEVHSTLNAHTDAISSLNSGKQDKLAAAYNDNVPANANKVWGLNAAGTGYEWKTAQLSAELPSTPIAMGVPRRNPANNALEWARVGQEVGDVLVTARATVTPSYVLPDTIYSRAAYPELFAVVGTIAEKNDGANLASLSYGVAGFICNGMAYGNGVLIVVGYNTTVGSGGTNSSNSGQALRSTDNGTTWTVITSLTGGYGLGGVGTDDAGVWVIGNGNGQFLRSTDNGLTWSTPAAMSGINGIQASMSIVCNRKGVWIAALYADSSYTTMSRSVNNGVTWTSIDLSGIGVSYPYYNMVPDYVTGDFWLQGGSYYLYKSANAGDAAIANAAVKWTQMFSNGTTSSVSYLAINAGLVVFQFGSSTYISLDQGTTYKVVVGLPSGRIFVDPEGVITISVGLSKYYRSYDYGETWGTFTQTIVSVNATDASGKPAVAYDAATGTWILGNGTSVFYRSTRLYNYDVATQFKTPAYKTPKNLKAFIKAKVDIV